MTCFRNRNNLSSTALAIFGSLNDTWKIKNLDFGTIVDDLAGDSRELAGVRFGYESLRLHSNYRCELISRGCKISQIGTPT